MSLKRCLIFALVIVVVFGLVVAAQQGDDEDDDAPKGSEGQKIHEVSEGVDAEDAADELDDDMDSKDEGPSSGLKASSLFLNYPNLKVPAGERLEILVPVSNVAGNPTYEIGLVAAHLLMFDHQRYVQNFSAQAYARTLEAGETATVKYTVTPDVLLEPSEYAFVLAAYVKTDDNTTLMVTAFNGTMTVVDPLGFDFKGLFSIVTFFGAIGGAVYFVLQKRQANRPAPRRAPKEVETGTAKKDTAYDPEFIDPSHLAYLNAKTKRNRSASK